MPNPVPQALTSFRVYLDSEDLLGVADVELPELEAITEEVKGAGIAGTVDTPILGHYGGLTLTLNWRTVSGNTTILSQPKAHQLDLRGSIQEYEAGEGVYATKAAKLVVKAIPKKTSLGKLEAGAAMETKSEFEVVYLKLTLGDEERIEIDKFNYVCKIEGEDFLEKVRADLGLK